MDKLGHRIIEERAVIEKLRKEATEHEWKARAIRREADEMERLLELARES